MAAKVVMVAVPTVLGIASIRVYTVREVSPDGLITREKLNIYNPLPPSTQVHFVPDKPGAIESGLTAARESVLPFFQAVKGACVSVKRGSVNLYHAGEDVFYYLKDPPPDFLPRFGTITVAGLLGMFLARKGSRFKRLAVPLSLMTAGATVCYPAQAVAVFKVTGKKVYAAGQWSSAAVSSLLTTKSQQPVAKETVASQPQTATVPNPESAVVEEAQSAPCHASEPSSTADSSAQSTTVSETEVESVETLPVPDKPIVTDITEEASSVTLTEISPEKAPSETNTDVAVQSVSAESSPLSEELPAAVESEEPSALKPASEDVSTEATQSLEPESVDPAPVEPAPPTEEPPASKTSEEPAAEPEPAAVEEEPTLTHIPPPPLPPLEEPPAENNKGGSGYKPDPSLMDFGQSNPEDEDLYSTRS